MQEVNSSMIFIFLYFPLHIYINLFLVGLSRDVVGVDHVGLHSTSWLWNIDHVGLTLIADTTLPLAQHPINNKNKQRALFSLLTKADKYKQPISSAAVSQWQQPRTKRFKNVNPRPFSHQLAQPCSSKSFLLTYLCPQKAPLFICATCRSPFFAQPSGAWQIRLLRKLGLKR